MALHGYYSSVLSTGSLFVELVTLTYSINYAILFATT